MTNFGTYGRRLALREIRDRPSNEYVIRGFDPVSCEDETVILSGDSAIKYIKCFPGNNIYLEAR